MINKTFNITFNNEKNSAIVELGYSADKVIQEGKFIDLGLDVKEIDTQKIQINNLTEELQTEVIANLNKIGNSLYESFCEMSYLGNLKNQVSNGVSILLELTPDNVENSEDDDIVIMIDDILSCEEQILICKEKILESKSMCPLVSNEIDVILSIMDSMASKEIINEDSLNPISNELFGKNYSKSSLSNREIINVKKIAVLDFLIKNSDDYLNTYRVLEQKINALCN